MVREHREHLAVGPHLNAPLPRLRDDFFVLPAHLRRRGAQRARLSTCRRPLKCVSRVAAALARAAQDPSSPTQSLAPTPSSPTARSY
eukprot:1791213-Pleurochrysis_carterae.AAC.2